MTSKTPSTSLTDSMRSVTKRMHAYPDSVIVMVVIVIVKSMRPCQSLNAATGIAANHSHTGGIGGRSKCDHAPGPPDVEGILSPMTLFQRLRRQPDAFVLSS